MAHWFVTTGRSVFDSSRCWNFVPPEIRAHDGKSDLELLRTEGVADLIPDLYGERSQRFGNVNNEQEIQAFVNEWFDCSCWHPNRYRALPAELATLFWLSQPVADQQEHTIQEGDTIHLIQGVGNEAALYLRPMLENCMDHHAVPDGVEPLPQVGIELMGPFALDPVDQEAFTQGFAEMWQAITALQDVDQTQARFVLTGGYKGVLLGLALKISGYQGVLTRIYYSHEEATRTVIRIGYTAGGMVTSNTLPQWVGM